MLRHKGKSHSNFVLEFDKEDKIKLAYELARSSVFRVEEKYEVENMKIIECSKIYKTKNYKCKSKKMTFDLVKYTIEKCLIGPNQDNTPKISNYFYYKVLENLK